MSDAAFKSAPYPGCTTAQLREFVADPDRDPISAEVMRREIERREMVAAGDVSVMTPGERLRFADQQQATHKLRARNGL